MELHQAASLPRPEVPWAGPWAGSREPLVRAAHSRGGELSDPRGLSRTSTPQSPGFCVAEREGPEQKVSLLFETGDLTLPDVTLLP